MKLKDASKKKHPLIVFGSDFLLHYFRYGDTFFLLFPFICCLVRTI